MTARTQLANEGSARKRWSLTILLTMYAGYLAFMLCRNALIAASAAMIDDPTLGLDKEKYGQLMSWHSAGAIVGKIVTGLGADLLGGRKTFLLALLFTAASNVAFGMASSLSLFKVFNFSGQFCKAGGWPAMAKIIGHWYTPNQHGRVWSVISTSSRVGTMLALYMIGSLLAVASWRSAFYLTAAITVGIVIAGYFLLKERPQDAGLSALAEDTVETHTHPLDGTTLGEACLVFVGSARVWLVCAGIACLTVLVDFITFIPIYLRETLGVSAAQASMSSTSFLAGMFVALIVAGISYDRFTKRGLTIVLGSQLVFGCLCVLQLWMLPKLGVPESLHSPVAVTTLFAFGFSIATAYYIPMSIFSIAFGGPHSGFLIAAIDIAGYSAALVFNYFGGTIAQDYGWTVFLRALLTVAVLATLSMTAFLFLDARAERLSGRR